MPIRKTPAGSSMARLHGTKTFRPQAELDHLTPSCRFCGEEHVGMNTESRLMLLGSYVFSAEYGQELFILSPDTQLSIVTLANGQLAFAADVAVSRGAVAASHLECEIQLLKEVGHAADDDGEFDEDEDEDDEDEDDIETIELEG